MVARTDLYPTGIQIGAQRSGSALEKEEGLCVKHSFRGSFAKRFSDRHAGRSAPFAVDPVELPAETVHLFLYHSMGRKLEKPVTSKTSCTSSLAFAIFMLPLLRIVLYTLSSTRRPAEEM